MSWMKHRAVPGSGASGRPAPSTSATPQMPPVQMYNPNQHSNQTINTQWQQVDLTTPSNNTWYDNQHQNNTYNWHEPQQNHPQHYPNQHQQSTALYQQPQQVHYQQQTYQPTMPQQQQPPMQQYMNSSSVNAVDNKADVWNDWNTWGDEDNSNNRKHVTPDASLNANVKEEIVEDSFAPNQSWSWGNEEQKTILLADNDQHANDRFPKVNLKTENSDSIKQQQFTKPVKSETVTPQWSIESQPSQDSSTDDVALLQSDTEQKYTNTTTSTNTTTTNSNPPSSTDLTSSSLSFTNTSCAENKEVIGLHQTQTQHIGLPNISELSAGISAVSSDLQTGQSMIGNKNSLAQIVGSAIQQNQHLRAAAVTYRNKSSIKNISPENIEVPSSALLLSERNQYLETGQLLGDSGADVDTAHGQREPPPPAFSRVVVGQRESGDDIRFGATSSERTVPAGSAAVRTSTYRPRGDTSDDDDEDSAFDDNDPLTPSFPTQPIHPRSATIGAEILIPSPLSSPSTIPQHPTAGSANFQEQRDTHLDGANTLDDDPSQSSSGGIGMGGEIIPSFLGGDGGGLGEGGVNVQEGREGEISVIVGGVRQMALVSGGESDGGQGVRVAEISGRRGDAPKRRSSKQYTMNDSSEDLPVPLSDDHLIPPHSASSQQQQQRLSKQQQRSFHNQQRSSTNNRNRNTPTPPIEPSHRPQERGDNAAKVLTSKENAGQLHNLQRRPQDNGRRAIGARGDYGRDDRRRGDYRRRDRSEDSDYDRDGGVFSGGDDARRGEEVHRSRYKVKRDVGVEGEEAYGQRDGRVARHKGGDRDRYRHRDDPRTSAYYRSVNKRRDDYDEYDDDGGGVSRASSRSESLQEVYRGDRIRDRDRRHNRGDRDADRRDRHGGGRGYGGGRADRDPYAGGAYMQGYYDPYGHNSAHAHPYYYQQYQYYENLRITNPQAYADWYRKFYQGQQQQNVHAHQQGIQRSVPVNAASINTPITEDRASLHSGRSSANDDLAKERYLRHSYYGGHNAAPMLHQQHNASGYYHRDVVSVSSHYGLDDPRQFNQDYTDSTLNTSFQPIESTSTSLSHFGRPPITTSQIIPQRLTPAKFSTSHSIGSLSSAVFGRIVHVPVHYPQHGDSAVVQLVGLSDFLAEVGDDAEYQDMVRFPGPLVRGITHKKTVIEYCEEKIRSAREEIATDCDSYILLWELLILLLSHNGVVVGADISDLLMRNNRSQHLDQNIRPSSVNSNTSSNACIEQNSNSEASNVNIPSDNKIGGSTALKEDAITSKFRQFLIYGSVKEALEWAMKNGLWGHALFLASKLDKRTYANVMKRFANGLPINDPLQTLYQLLSGSIPAAVTCVAEERWGDWRPHLAMILANSTSNPELERRSICNLGDTLDSRGSIYAAQFCYLMAQVEFSAGKLSNVADENQRLILLGADKRNVANVRRFAKTEAIHMTEVYEYACGLNSDGYFIPAFQTYKYLLATRLCDHGLVERSLGYLERIAMVLLANAPSSIDTSYNTSTLTGSSGNSAIFRPIFVQRVCQLADRLRYCDPTDDLQTDDAGDEGTGGNGWLDKLVKLDKDYTMGLISQSITQNQDLSDGKKVDTSEELSYEQKIWKQPQPIGTGPEHMATLHRQQQWQEEPTNQQQPFSLDQTLTEGQTDYNQPNLWSLQSQQLSAYNSPVSSDLQDHLQSPDSLHWNHTQTEPTTPVVKSKGDTHPSPSTQPSDDVAQHRQQISMPNQSSRKAYDDLDDETSRRPTSFEAAPTQNKSAKPTAKTENKGWLDGIFGRFSIRPKNQMKLPDDKNPTIVWDPAKKRWINTEEDGGDAVSELRPPPKMPDIRSQPASLPSMNLSAQSASTFTAQPPNSASNIAAQAPLGDANAVTGKPPILGGNMFKMQRGRNLKKSYVDVFNPGGVSASGGGSAPSLMADGNSGNTVPSAVVPNFFIPPPVADSNAPVDFLTPTTGMPSIDHQQQYENN